MCDRAPQSYVLCGGRTQTLVLDLLATVIDFHPTDMKVESARAVVEFKGDSEVGLLFIAAFR